MSLGDQATFTAEELRATIKLLPPEAIDELIDQPPYVVDSVVSQIRTLVDYWESHQITLDPIQFAAVVTPIVIALRVQAQVILRLSSHV